MPSGAGCGCGARPPPTLRTVPSWSNQASSTSSYQLSFLLARSCASRSSLRAAFDAAQASRAAFCASRAA
eukprot:3207908-Alexandrium_andersonii.AAC.1